MKTEIILMVLFCMGTTGISPISMGQELPKPETTTITFAQKANPHFVTGFGGEWDPHYWRSYNTRRGCDEKNWEIVKERIRSLHIGRVRMMLMPDWYEPVNDDADPNHLAPATFTWDSEAMQALYRQLDFCQEAGIRVNLTWWCAPLNRQGDGATYWLAYPKGKDWCSAPNNVAECAENIVAALHYLVRERHYTCIDAFTFVNEPDWTFKNNENKVDFEYYAENCRAIHAKLKQAGLRKRITLDLADDSSHQGWIQKTVEKLDDITDHYNAHSYIFSCEDPDYPPKMRTWVRERVKWCGDKPFSTNELGTRHYQGAYSVKDLETFERAFCVAQYAILGLNEGLSGALYWGLYDQYYYDGNNPEDGSNGGRMKTNLMTYGDEGWRVRLTGQVWSLICQAAPYHSKVFPGSSRDASLDAVALKAPGKGITHLLLVNRARTSRSVLFENIPGGLRPYRTATIAPFSRDGIKNPETRNWSSTTPLAMLPESVVLVSLSPQ